MSIGRERAGAGGSGEIDIEDFESMQSTFRFGDQEFNSESQTDVSGTATYEVSFEALEEEDEDES